MHSNGKHSKLLYFDWELILNASRFPCGLPLSWTFMQITARNYEVEPEKKRMRCTHCSLLKHEEPHSPQTSEWLWVGSPELVMTFSWQEYLGEKLDRSSSELSLHSLLIKGVPTILIWLSSSTCFLCAGEGPKGGVDFDAVGIVMSFCWSLAAISLWVFFVGMEVNSFSGVGRSGKGMTGWKFPWWSSVRMHSTTFFMSSIIDELAPVEMKITLWHLWNRRQWFTNKQAKKLHTRSA